jgi:hypothetical protein
VLRQGGQGPGRQPGADPLEVDQQPGAGRDLAQDLLERRHSRPARQQVPALPEAGGRPEHLGVADLEPAPAQVDVELDQVGRLGGGAQ